MATGDVSVVIEPDGWTALVTAAGFTSGATYAFGLTTAGNQKNVPTATTPYLTVVSVDTYNSSTRTRKVYLTMPVRFPYGTLKFSGAYTLGTFQDGETATGSISACQIQVVGSPGSGGFLYGFITNAGTPNAADVWTGGTSAATFAATNAGTAVNTPVTNEQVPTAGLTVRVALSDYVFQKDNTGGGNSGTAPTFTAPSGFITNTGGASQPSNVATAIAVTNSSTCTYQPTILAWTWPDHYLIQGATMKLRILAFSGTAQNGKPVQAITGTVTDAHSHSVPFTVTIPTYDSTVGDAVPIVEYIPTISTATFTNGDLLTANCIAYPWYGDATSATTTSGGTQPSPNPAPQTFQCDTGLTYGQSAARVTSTGSDAGANTVYPLGSFNPTTAYQFATIDGALKAMATYNNANFSRNNCGGGTVFLDNGAYAWTGGSNSYGAGTPSVYTVITANTGNGATQAGVTISSQTGKQNINGLIQFVGVSLTGAAVSMVTGAVYVWADQCILSSTSSAWFFANSMTFITRCSVGAFTQGLVPFSTTNSPFAIIRGNNLNGFKGGIQAYCIIGNLKTTVDASQSYACVSNVSSTTTPVPAHGIIAYNIAYGWNGASGNAWHSGFVTVPIPAGGGLAIVQNLVESINSSSTTQLVIAVSNDNSTNASNPRNNVLLFNNTMIGGRTNNAYNDDAANSPACKFWYDINNYWDAAAHKTDTFNSNPSQNGIRQGNWPSQYGVGYTGSFDAETIHLNAAASFMLEFYGLGTYNPTLSTHANLPNTSATNIFNFAGFTSNQASTGLANGLGNGTYTLTNTSPLIGMQSTFILPIDLSGAARSATNAPAGAFQYPPQSNTPGGAEATGLGSGAGVGLKYGLGNSGLGRWWGI